MRVHLCWGGGVQSSPSEMYSYTVLSVVVMHGLPQKGAGEQLAIAPWFDPPLSYFSIITMALMPIMATCQLGFACLSVGKFGRTNPDYWFDNIPTLWTTGWLWIAH